MKITLTVSVDGHEIHATRERFISIEQALLIHDPFVGVNSQGVTYAQTPCWSLLRMPVPEITSPEAQERARQERHLNRLFS